MSTQRLTKTILDFAKYTGNGSTPMFIWDQELKGFGVRIYPSGKKSFLITYRNDQNKQRFMILGKYGVLTVQEAKELAKDKLREVSKGEDPLVNKRNKAIGEKFEEFSKTYLERYAKTEKRSWQEDQRRLNAHLIPKLGPLILKNIDRSHIAKLHYELGKESIYEANRTLALLSKMFNLAQQWGAVEQPFSNPTKGIDKYKEKSRERWLTDKELLKLNTALLKEQNVYARNAIVLFLLTGMRKNELLKSKWEHIKVYGDSTELLIPETKAGKEQTIHLSKAALNLLKQIPKLKDNPYIFAGSRSGHHLVNIDKPWRRIRKDAGIEDVHIHDLRRTLGSRMVQAGHSLKVVKETLRHKDLKTTEIYARIGEKQKQDALEGQGQTLEVSFMEFLTPLPLKNQ